MRVNVVESNGEGNLNAEQGARAVAQERHAQPQGDGVMVGRVRGVDPKRGQLMPLPPTLPGREC